MRRRALAAGIPVAALGRMTRIAAAVLTAALATACTGGDDFTEPHQILPRVEDGNFTLYVSNQSFEIDPVDVQVRLDGKLAVEGDFLVEGQHSWHVFPFEVGLGAHTLEAITVAGDATITEIFTISDDRWAVLDFWYYPGDPEPTPRQFSFYLYDEPPQFE